MDKIKKVKPVFFASFTLGIVLILIYIFTLSPLASGSGSAKADGIPDGELLSVGQVSGMTADTYESEREALLAEGAGNDPVATSRGDEDRVTTAAVTAPVKTAASNTAPAKPAASAKTTAEQASAPAKTPAKASAPAAAAVPKTESATKPATAAVPKTESAANPATADAPAQSTPAKTAAPAQTTPVKPTSGYAYDLDLLARLITAEAQGEPYKAQVGVGAVVMNRVKSSDWPNTIKDVIYQEIDGYYQFTPVVNGWIDKPADPQCIEAAKDAINGVDPTNGAQFYYDDSVTNQWILAKPVSAQFGDMVFAY